MLLQEQARLVKELLEQAQARTSEAVQQVDDC